MEPGHISRYASGKIVPRTSNLKRVLDAFGLTEEQFLIGELSRPEPHPGQLELLCDIEVLLGLARRLIEGYKEVAGDTAPETSPGHMTLDVTYQALYEKVGEIRDQIRKQTSDTPA